MYNSSDKPQRLCFLEISVYNHVLTLNRQSQAIDYLSSVNYFDTLVFFLSP